MQTHRAKRLELIDALRAFALFGILQVNIQSFVWGPGDPLGYFADVPRTVDSITYLLVGILVSSKFISLFAFLFGFGFALQIRSLRGALQGLAAAQQAYRRRLWFLLALGVAHGIVLYSGDILAAYAVCGFILVTYAGLRPTQLAHKTRQWWIACAVIFLVVMGGLAMIFASLPSDDEAMREKALEAFSLYTTAGFAEQVAQRAEDYLLTLISLLLLMMPLVLSLFLLGALAARLGWLHHPERHPRVWRAAVRIGALGLIPAAIGVWLNYQSALATAGNINLLAGLFILFGSVTIALYVALIVKLRHTRAVGAAIAWLAPAGRMPLTNYLMQSVLIGALLSGWGLGLGAVWRHAELSVLALVIVFAQVAASRWWMARFGAGPMEAIWRKATYGR
jgi:uncharacterized protein